MRNVSGTTDALIGSMKLVVVTLTVAVAVAVSSLAACHGGEKVGTTQPTSAEIADPKAADQSNAPDDLELVRAIRQRLVSDRVISMRAKNAVVVVQDGVVTLRGDASDSVDHDLVIAKVISVPGVVRVDDRLVFPKE